MRILLNVNPVYVQEHVAYHIVQRKPPVSLVMIVILRMPCEPQRPIFRPGTVVGQNL